MESKELILITKTKILLSYRTYYSVIKKGLIETVQRCVFNYKDRVDCVYTVLVIPVKVRSIQI